MNKEELFEKIKNILIEEFELEADSLVPEALLGDDLDLDSIDAIDLIVKMKEYTPEGKPNLDPTIFKSAKTLQDVVDALYNAWN